MNINASIIGANGYTGLELINILLNHDNVTLKYLVSRSNAGKKVIEVYPSLIARIDLTFTNPTIEEIAQVSDVVFLALPHGKSASFAGKLNDLGVKVIDLSADFRYNNINTYQKIYGVNHPRIELNSLAIYGLCEIYREQIRNASIVANPGCYTTCAILPLYPLLKNKIISTQNIIIDAKSGISGAGRKPSLDYIYTETAENFKAYALTTHRHTSEIEEQLSVACGNNVELSFAPHLLPIKRGILSTIYTDIIDIEADIHSIYKEFYNQEPFIHILPEATLPEIKNVAGSNNIHIGFIKDSRLNKLIIVSCLDNLIKGASGQAVQNMNIMYGIKEDKGLNFTARYI